MTLSANDHFRKRELSIGELETAAGGLFGLIPIVLPPPGLLIPLKPHPHQPLPPHLNVPIIIPPFGFL